MTEQQNTQPQANANPTPTATNKAAVGTPTEWSPQDRQEIIDATRKQLHQDFPVPEGASRQQKRTILKLREVADAVAESVDWDFSKCKVGADTPQRRGIEELKRVSSMLLGASVG